MGGDFTYAPPTTRDMGDLLLIGGGVGINPLFSMLQHHTWLLQTAHDNSEQGPGSIEPRKDSMSVGRVCLLYSAKTKDELLFKVGVLVYYCSLGVASSPGFAFFYCSIHQFKKRKAWGRRG